MNKKAVWIGVLAVVIILLISLSMRSDKNLVTSEKSVESAGLITYTNDTHGFEFSYPQSWKKVVDVPSTEVGEGDGTVTNIYSDDYPAHDRDARIALFPHSLTVTLKTIHPYVLNNTTTKETINSIVWEKMQMTYADGSPMDAYGYLTEVNGRTYTVDGSRELTEQIVANFKFKN